MSRQKKILNLKILQYNVQLIHQIHISSGNNARAKLIAEKIGTKYKNIDVITFCEAFTQTARNILIRNLKKYGYNFHTPVLNISNIKSNGGIFIISKHPIINYKFYVYNSTKGTDSLVEKGVVKATLIIKNTTVNIFATHLQAWDTPENELIRIEQINELQNFITQQNLEKKDIVIVSGDFNTSLSTIKKSTLNKFIFPKLTSRQKYTSDPSSNSFVGLDGADKYYNCVDSYYDNIINSKENVYKKNFTYCECCPKEMLDYIFYINDFKKPTFSENKIISLKTDIYKFKLWRLSWLNSIYFYTTDLSDHYPILGSFKFEIK